MQPFNQNEYITSHMANRVPTLNGIGDFNTQQAPFSMPDNANKKSIAAALIGLAGTAIAGGLSAYSAHRANKANERMNQQNLEFNRMQNELAYQRSLPANQRKLMEEAGFNPNLLTGIAPTADSASAPSSLPMQSVFNGSFDPLTFSNINLQSAQADNLRAQAEATRSDTALNPLRREQIQATIDQIYENNKLIQPTIEKIKSDKALNDQQKLFLCEQSEKLTAEIENLWRDWELKGKDFDLKDMEYKNLSKDLQVKNSEIALNRALTAVHKATEQLVKQNATNAGYQGELLALQRDFESATYNKKVEAAMTDLSLSIAISDDRNMNLKRAQRLMGQYWNPLSSWMLMKALGSVYRGDPTEEVGKELFAAAAAYLALPK